MNRRKFTFSLAALGLAPLLPVVKPVRAMVSSAGSASAGAGATLFTKAEYKWAEVIVRAHKYCSTGMIERHLKIGTARAAALEAELVKNGAITATTNAYNMRLATKPLWEEMVPTFKTGLQKTVKKLSGKISDSVEDKMTRTLEIEEGNTNSEPFFSAAEMSDSPDELTEELDTVPNDTEQSSQLI